MRSRFVLATSLVALLALGAPLAGANERGRRPSLRGETVLPKGFRPAILSTRGLGRYFVELKAPSLAERGGGHLAPGAQGRVVGSAMRSQDGAVQEVRSLGGKVLFRYARLVNAFSASMSAADAAELAKRADVARVEPVPIVVRLNDTSVPFIGALKVWRKLGVRGQGMTVAVVDTGVDYTHADFGGPGTPAAYTSNDPNVIEPGTFPTAKVIGGYDFVGANYDVLDASTTNDTPVPDPDPLDKDGHGTHVAGTCCGMGVPGSVGKGVAPQAKILAVKVWDVGNSTADVLVAGYEFAVDPNGDGNTNDAADVLSFSGGVDYGAGSSIEAKAAKDVVKLGTVFVAAAGNAGNQPNGGSGYILGTPAAAKSVIAVGASIDQFSAQKLTVHAPSGVSLPDGGPIVAQDWAGAISADITGDVLDARAVSPVAAANGEPAPTDRMLCDSTPTGSPFAGKIALAFMGPFAEGDCTADDKVLNAQKAGATAVILWDGFGGLPAQYSPGTSASQVTIPAVSLSGKDSKALAAAISPNAPTSYNTVAGNVTLGSMASVSPDTPTARPISPPRARPASPTT
jgi:minor extracellular serine protease Vpr